MEVKEEKDGVVDGPLELVFYCCDEHWEDDHDNPTSSDEEEDDNPLYNGTYRTYRKP
jgi:hypothetical protein